LEPTFYLSEIFESIQGEGNYAGANSLFLRFQFCNFTCSWCDTKYTWFKDSGAFKAFSAEEIKEKIIASQSPNVIFTGGEPTLYPLDKLVVPGKKFHVETNGSIIPILPLDITLADNNRMTREAMDEAVISRFNWVVSPKLSNSRQKLNEESLRFWASREYCIFKFVVRNSADMDEVEGLINQYTISKQKIYVALEGQTLESQLKPDLVDEIVRRGWNFSPRLHVLLWGTKKKK
jgi:Organic radical activating enzymes